MYCTKTLHNTEFISIVVQGAAARFEVQLVKNVALCTAVRQEPLSWI